MDSEGFWRTDKDYARIKIRGLVIERQVGIHPWEQHPERPNRLVIDVDILSTSYTIDFHDEPILDYDGLRKALRDWPLKPHTLHLETLVEEVLEICFRDSRVEAARVSIIKPDIFNEANGAGVELYRLRKK